MKDSCLIIEPLFAAYALDALDVQERRQVDTHLDTCPECQRALADYQSVSAGLLAAPPAIQPPPRLRARLIAQTAPGVQKPGLKERLSLLRPQLMPAAAITAILVLAFLNLTLLRSTDQIIKNQEILAKQNKAYQTAFALLTYPDSEIAVIDDGDIYGTLIYDSDGQVAVLNVWGLETLPEGQDYQVWLIEPDQTRVSGGVFQSSDQTEYVSFVIVSPTTLDNFTGMGVTIEPEGGSPGPTGPRIFGTEL